MSKLLSLESAFGNLPSAKSTTQLRWMVPAQSAVT